MADINLAVTCLSALLVLPWIGAVLCRRVDVLSPVLLFTVYVFIGYVLPVPAFLAGLDPVSTSWVSDYGDFDRSLRRALWVTIAGVIGFYLGYAATRDLIPGVRMSVRPQISRWRDQRLLGMSVLYVASGLLLFSIGVALIGGPTELLLGLSNRVTLSAGLNYFFYAINLLLVVSLIWWTRALSEQRLPRLSFWIYTASAVALAALQGSKIILFFFALTMTLVYHVIRRRVSPVRLAVLVIVFVPVLSLYTIYIREYVVLGELRSIESTEGWLSLLWLLVTREFASNFVQLQALTLVVDRVPDILEFQHGRTLLAMLTIAVPSGWYPEKYLTAPGVFTLAIDPDRWVREGTTLPPGLIGEMYMNFGTTGVVLGLSCFGAVFGWIRRTVKRRGSDPATAVLYALSVAMLAHYIRGELVSPTVLLLIFALPTVLLLAMGLAERRPTLVDGRTLGGVIGETVS
jgi:oligosaccharide repeat unit polymerase